MSKIIAAYLAGLIDGEGYLGILKTKRGNKKRLDCARDYKYEIVLKVCMTDKNLIEWLKNSFGGTFETRWRYKKMPNSKPSYGWMIRHSQVKRFLRYLYPHFRTKRKQAEVLFQFNEIERKGGALSEEEWNKRDSLYAIIRQLNKRGVA